MRALKTGLTFLLIALFALILGCSEDSEESPEEPKDTTPPTITSTFPSNGASDVTRSGPYWLLFSEAMNKESVEGAIVIESPGFSFTPAWTGDTLFITPSELLSPGTTYNITIGTGAEDLAGNNMESAFTLTFTTTNEEDTTPPTITSTYPADGATNIPGAADIEITFSEPMQMWPTESAVTIEPQPDDIDFDWESTKLVIHHSSFGSNVDVTVTVSTGAMDLAGNHLASTYSFDFTTMEDNTRPYLESASPAKNATNVSQNLSSVILTFSEPMDETSFENIGPTELDARFMQLLDDDPEFDPTTTTLTIDIVRKLLPGCTYWVKFLDVTDQAGNVIEPNPTSYSFTTAGNKTYFPFIEPNKWHYQEDSYYWTNEVENYNPANGYFEMVDRDNGIIQHKDIMRYSAADNVIYHLGTEEYDDYGTFEFSMTWDSPLEYLKLPVENHLGDSWTLSSTGTATTAESGSYSLTLSGSVQLEPSMTDIVSNEFYATFKDCITMHLYVQIAVYDGGTLIEEMNIHNINYLAPGVGAVKIIENDLNESTSDTTYIYNWETK